jgi:hypothetical protein
MTQGRHFAAWTYAVKVFTLEPIEDRDAPRGRAGRNAWPAVPGPTLCHFSLAARSLPKANCRRGRLNKKAATPLGYRGFSV